MPESSPSRQSAKRRMADSPIEDVEGDTQEDYVNAVIASLAMPEGDKPAPVVSTLWSNEAKFDEHVDGVTAFAKIAGCNWTYYVQELVIRIGRTSETFSAAGSTASATSPALHPEDKVHIDLGPSKSVSRKHAIISYDGECSGEDDWRIHVFGVNGITIDDDPHKKDAIVVLRSGNVIEIGGVQMMFVLPNKTPVIAPSIRRRARLREYIVDEEVPLEFDPVRIGASYDLDMDVATNLLSPGLPPVRAQTETPVLIRRLKRPRLNPQPSSGGGAIGIRGNCPAPIYHRGVSLEMPEDVDYSQDAMKRVKPPYSFALMIAHAILSSESGQLTLAAIYKFITDKYSYFRHTNVGWQSSIRNNLSMNKAFRRIASHTDEPGKCTKWGILPDRVDEYVAKLRKPSQGVLLSSFPPGSPPSFSEGSQQTRQSLLHSRSDPPIQTTEGNGSPHSSVTPPPLPADSVQPDTSGHGSSAPSLTNPEQTSVGTPRTPIHDDTGLSSSQSGSPTPAGSELLLTSPFGESDPFNDGDDDDSFDFSTLAPVPRRQYPRPNPPNTGRRPPPFSLLPTSSPAPFWKYMHSGSTPSNLFGYSPPKDRHSSSPPRGATKPEDSPKGKGVRVLGSPMQDGSGDFSHGGPSNLPRNVVPADREDDDDEDGIGDFSGVDLGF